MLNYWSNNLYLRDLTIQIKLLEQVVKETIHKRKPVMSDDALVSAAIHIHKLIATNPALKKKKKRLQ
jgi:hypothetical protein